MPSARSRTLGKGLTQDLTGTAETHSRTPLPHRPPPSPVPSLPHRPCQRRPPPCPSSSRRHAFSRAAPLVPARRARARRARPPAAAPKPPPPAKFGPPAAPVTAPHATPPATPRLRVAPRARARPRRPLPPAARCLDSSRPHPAPVPTRRRRRLPRLAPGALPRAPTTQAPAPGLPRST